MFESAWAVFKGELKSLNIYSASELNEVPITLNTYNEKKLLNERVNIIKQHHKGLCHDLRSP